MLNWKITNEDARLVIDIVDRMAEETKQPPVDKRTTMMDLTACHVNGCELDLAGLLKASRFDLFHDVYGISAHIDRKTGQLQDCFLPRYAKANSAAA